MSRQAALDMLTTAGGTAYLQELYGKVIDGVQKNLISARMKNRDLSGDPISGTVVAKRFKNATSAAYGTARTRGSGDAVKADEVTIAINTDKEIVEELEEKDVRLYGVQDVMNRRARNHTLRMAAELDTAFFSAAGTAANGVTCVESDNIEITLEKVIQACETVKNDFVDGVPRSMMYMVMDPGFYGKIRNRLDTCERANIDTDKEEFLAWHGVDVQSCTHLPVGIHCLLMVEGSVAQPVMSDQYKAEKIPLSDATAVELFYHYGTQVVTSDLIFTPSFYTKDTTVTSENFATKKANLYVFNTTTGEYDNQAAGTYSATAVYYTKNA